MATAEKQAAIAELADSFRGSSAAVLTEYRGLTVKQLSELRGSLRGHATYAVVKNTLTELAAKEAGVTAFDGQLVGPSAIAFVTGDPVEAAKGLRDFARTNPLLVIKGGVLDGKAMTAAEITKLADLESREVLLAKLAGAMNASLTQAVYLFAAPLSQSARLIEALRAKREAEGPQDAAAPQDAARRTRLRRTRPRREHHPPGRGGSGRPVHPPGRRHGWRHRLSQTAQLTSHATQARTGRNATMAKLSTDELLDAFKEMTLIELSEFVKQFEDTFGVTAAAPVAVAAPGAAAAGGGDAAAVEEQDEFDVVLEAAGDKKIQVIKEVRALTSLGLKEAKDLVDGAPKPVLEKVDKAAADKAKEQLEAAGATVTLK